MNARRSFVGIGRKTAEDSVDSIHVAGRMSADGHEFGHLVPTSRSAD
jgi:hypothetical protein